MMNSQVSIIMGSDSDLPIMEEAAKILESFEIPFEVKILSAHRTPLILEQYLETALDNGVQCIICGAGMAAHLAGSVAAKVTIPVLGVPLGGSIFNGVDALLSTVQMPGGIPVGTFGVGKSGAVNAALFAIQILSLQSEALVTKLKEHRKNQVDTIVEKNLKLKKSLLNTYKSICFSDK